jgi:NCAIR mutase (PurE)-related protein
MWDEEAIRDLLGRVARGQQTVDEAFANLRSLPYEEAGNYAKLDHHRSLRPGFPEVVFCAGKTTAQARINDKSTAQLHAA